MLKRENKKLERALGILSSTREKKPAKRKRIQSN